MRKTIENLIAEAEAVKLSDNIEKDFYDYLTRLRIVSADLIQRNQNAQTVESLGRLANFRPYDELTLIGKILVKLLALKWQGSDSRHWRTKGKYRYDLNEISLSLRGILHGIEGTAADA